MVVSVVAFVPVHASLAKVFAAVGPVVRSGSVCSRWAMGVTPSSVHHTASQELQSRIGEKRHLQHSARAYRALRLHCTPPSPKNGYSQSVQRGRGNKIRPHLQDALLLYYHDVSSGPRPRAHRYMLTHRVAATRLPSGPRIALH